MKLHFTYNLPDIAQALKVAEQTAECADILGVGSLLLFKEGIKAIQAFKTTFPNKEIFVEANLVEKADLAVTMMAQAGASYISVLAGTFNQTIKKAVETANRFDVKIALNLLDSHSMGQTAMDAKTLGVHLLIMHHAANSEDMDSMLEEWRNVRDNTKLPIFVTGKIDLSNLTEIIELKPQGIMIGAAVTKAENPSRAAHTLRELIP